MVNLPQPTVWRLCYTLMKKGLLTYSPLTKRLRLGVPVLGLGYAVVASQMIAEIARPHMQAIADRFRGTVSLGAADGLGMIYLQRCEGASVVLVNNRVGSRVPIAYSATGWAYLAALAPQAREDLVREIHAEEGPRWAQIEQRFRSALRKFHVDRYIINKGSLHRQINGVAVPLHFPDGDRPMGLGSSGINSIYTDEALRIIGGFLLDLASMLEAVPPRGRMAVYPVPGGH
jgi:DNA-binding IclR family transcriptional regulator